LAVVDALKDAEDEAVWMWMQEYHDWINEETGEAHTDYEPDTLTIARIEALSS